MRRIDWALRKDAFAGREDFCGDTGFVKEYGKLEFLALIDGLGHGEKAFRAASLSEEYFSGHYRRPLKVLMAGLDDQLHESVGAVAGIGRLSVDTGILNYGRNWNYTSRVLSEKLQSPAADS